MRTFTLLFLLVFAISKTHAQNYMISFAGSGASSVVDSVKVENLTQSTSVKLGGNDILQLIATVGINKINTITEEALHIYPNPMSEFSTIEFESPVSGDAVIEVIDMTGKKVIQTQNNLLQGNNKYLISGINAGVYTVQIISGTYTYTGKLLSYCNGIENSKIIYQSLSK